MTEARSQMARLLVLQEQDLQHDQLQYQIDHHPHLTMIADLHHQSVALEASMASVREDHARMVDRQSVIDKQVAEIDDRVRAIDKRLSGNASGSFRDQAAMSHEMDALIAQKRALEDEQLELMEATEPLEAQLSSATAMQRSLAGKARDLRDSMRLDQRALGAELAKIQGRRDAVAVDIPAPLLREYDRLRVRFGGVGAARLEHGVCSGCHLALSASELDHLRHSAPTELVHCEQCGRILVYVD